MSLFSIFKISSQGMTAQRERLEAASANLANSNTTRTAEGGPYRRRDVVFTTQEINNQWSENAMQSGLFGSDPNSGQGVKSEVVISDANQFQMQYQPGHPDAD